MIFIAMFCPSCIIHRDLTCQSGYSQNWEYLVSSMAGKSQELGIDMGKNHLKMLGFVPWPHMAGCIGIQLTA